MKQGASRKLAADIRKFGDGSLELHPFYSFEPWDVEERPDWVKKQAEKDAIDLYSEFMLKHCGADPHAFQTGYLRSTAFIRGLIAGSQTGKSIVALVDAICMATGELPFALRFEKGDDTKVKRAVTSDNIQRFGRFDTSTGQFIDKNVQAVRPEGWDEWDCGTILGAGKYPKNKIATPGSEIWLGTYMKALHRLWWPRLSDPTIRLIPDHVLDTTKKNGGYDSQEFVVYLINGVTIAAITYESGAKRFEAKDVWAIVADEEPLPDEKIFQSMQQHTKRVSLVMTPYNGITYTKDILFPKEDKRVDRDKVTEVFHASQYDSPYQSKDMIAKRRRNMNSWDIGARVWGFYCEQTGKPFFDREKLNVWLRVLEDKYHWATFRPKREYAGMVTNLDRYRHPGLLDISVCSVDLEENDLRTAWRIYETPRKGAGYVIGIDPAEGAESPEAVGDISAAIIMRQPIPDAGEEKPVIAATIRSTLETVAFARTCAYAMRYYNNCLLAAETRRGAANATFAAELRDWPWWYHHTSIQDSINKPRTRHGFDPNAATRSAIFKEIQAWLSEFEAEDDPCIPDEPLLREIAAAIIGKNGRCDHSSENTLDSTVAFGILLHVLKNAPEQLSCNSAEEETREGFIERAGRRAKECTEKLKYLGQRPRPAGRR